MSWGNDAALRGDVAVLSRFASFIAERNCGVPHTSEAHLKWLAI